MKARLAIIVAITIIAALLAVGLGVRKTDYAPTWLSAPIGAPRQSGELVILTLRGPTTTEILPGASKNSADDQTGFEHDLATLFAKELGVRATFKVASSHANLILLLAANRAHIAAAGLTPSPNLRQQFAFSPAYKTLQYQLIYRTATKRPKNVGALGGLKMVVIAETPAHDIARELTATTPTLAIEVLPHESSTEDLLKAVDASRADVALIDANAFAVSRRLYPDLNQAFSVGRAAKVAWAFSEAADYDLQQSSVKFFEKIRGNGVLNRLLDRYYGHVSRIQPVDTEALLEKIQTALPKLRAHFHEAEQLTGIDWRVLAAVGYQESHWNPLATSPTGVRGVMMLTEDTADRMKVNNRLEARDSIIGGAQYIALLRDTVPARIPEPDRTWLALAAYNQGYGHLEDARILTARQGLNADTWLDVRKAYPKLTEPEYFETLKHGYCRGNEAVQFVENIRNYTDMLMRLERRLEKPLDIDRETSSLDAAAEAFEKKRLKKN